MDRKYTAIGAIGAVLGYIGAEGATPAMFESLLWPQRSHAGLTWRNAFKLAILGPSGGPVYKAALQVLDNAFAFGLMRGSGLGHMLGTTFFPQTISTYTLHSNDPKLPSHTEPARNCLWVRVVALLPARSPGPRRLQDSEAGIRARPLSRTQTAVHHISLRVVVTPKTGLFAINTETDSRRLSAALVFRIIISELVGMTVAIVVAVVWKTALAVLWLCPVAIKLLSLLAAVGREPLSLDSVGHADRHLEKAQDFEVHIPSETCAFLILTGPPSLVLQFFRHFGHPKRNRLRENVQLALVAAAASLFPIGLLLSVTVMQESIQYTWISYQMYLVLAMYASRYMSVNLWATTEELIARKLAANPEGVDLWHDKGRRKVVVAELHTTCHGRYGEARAYSEKLVERNRRLSA